MAVDRFTGNQRGMALVLTLLTISFLVAVTVQFLVTIDRQVSTAAAQRQQVRLDAMVLAGLNLARAALAADRKEDDTQEFFLDGRATFDPERLAALAGDVSLTVTVTDLSGRLQVLALADHAKAAYREVWLRLLLSGRFAIADMDAAEALLASLGDWIDQDDDERQEGAEESYYRSRNPPYSCRNGPVATLDELLLVKGMTAPLLYGDNEHEGLANYITVLGEDGKINLKTAPLPVLQALSPGMTQTLAQELIAFREEQRHVKLLSNPDWYRQVSGFPGSIDFAPDLLTVTSKFFKIQVQAAVDQYSRTGTGILHRNNEQRQTLLLWKIE